MASTTDTLQNIKQDLEDWLSISVPQNIVILAYNDFANRVYKFEEENFPSRERKISDTVSVSPTGVTLSSVITDARDYDIGFEAYAVDSNGTLDLG